ncbi:unnamed protein product [Albugo candida]|uniref:tRNA-binding domain-containing protein n=1 Tax=Albugo candida TaxID=65357 RepID=A0A024GE51_9STRA|nr:unnamed protein product [Albugo candida]|eukprot:CCI45156.1 unnamed protein product [Albugo candida]
MNAKTSEALNNINDLIRDLEADLIISEGQSTDDAKSLIPTPRLSPSEVSPQPKQVMKAVKKEKQPKKSAPIDPVAENQSDISKLDLRVGKITKAWTHEKADKLYCEEIDVGEENARLVASGLRSHYKLEEMQNRLVVVLCNLKPRNMLGFRSHGMVMCAATTLDNGEEKVRFVEPPLNAKIGERVAFEGLSGEPWTPAQIEKKKVLDKIGSDMRTGSDGVAKYKDCLFSTSAGPCTAPEIVNGVIR